MRRAHGKRTVGPGDHSRKLQSTADRAIRRRAVQCRALPVPGLRARIAGAHPANELECALDDPRTRESDALRGQQEDRLDSWKKIASYLKRDVSTVQRWERREAMPVHRHLHDKQGSVFAFRSELDAWWESRRTRLTQDGAGENERAAQVLLTAEDASRAAAPRARPARSVLLALAAAVVLVVGALAWFAAETDYFWRNPLANAKFTRLLDFDGTEQAAAISRDGKFVAFLGDRDGQIDAWISEVGSGTYRNLTNGDVRDLVNPLLRALGFSADSSLVSIWTRRSDGSQPGDVNIFWPRRLPADHCGRISGGDRVRLVPRWQAAGISHHRTGRSDVRAGVRKARGPQDLCGTGGGALPLSGVVSRRCFHLFCPRRAAR